MSFKIATQNYKMLCVLNWHAVKIPSLCVHTTTFRYVLSPFIPLCTLCLNIQHMKYKAVNRLYLHFHSAIGCHYLLSHTAHCISQLFNSFLLKRFLSLTIGCCLRFVVDSLIVNPSRLKLCCIKKTWISLFFLSLSLLLFSGADYSSDESFCRRRALLCCVALVVTVSSVPSYYHIDKWMFV